MTSSINTIMTSSTRSIKMIKVTSMSFTFEKTEEKVPSVAAAAGTAAEFAMAAGGSVNKTKSSLLARFHILDQVKETMAVPTGTTTNWDETLRFSVPRLTLNALMAQQMGEEEKKEVTEGRGGSDDDGSGGGGGGDGDGGGDDDGGGSDDDDNDDSGGDGDDDGGDGGGDDSGGGDGGGDDGGGGGGGGANALAVTLHYIDHEEKFSSTSSNSSSTTTVAAKDSPPFAIGSVLLDQASQDESAASTSTSAKTLTSTSTLADGLDGDDGGKQVVVIRLTDPLTSAVVGTLTLQVTVKPKDDEGEEAHNPATSEDETESAIAQTKSPPVSPARSSRPRPPRPNVAGKDEPIWTAAAAAVGQTVTLTLLPTYSWEGVDVVATAANWVGAGLLGFSRGVTDSHNGGDGVLFNTCMQNGFVASITSMAFMVSQAASLAAQQGGTLWASWLYIVFSVLVGLIVYTGFFALGRAISDPFSRIVSRMVSKDMREACLPIIYAVVVGGYMVVRKPLADETYIIDDTAIAIANKRKQQYFWNIIMALAGLKFNSLVCGAPSEDGINWSTLKGNTLGFILVVVCYVQSLPCSYLSLYTSPILITTTTGSFTSLSAFHPSSILYPIFSTTFVGCVTSFTNYMDDVISAVRRRRWNVAVTNLLLNLMSCMTWTYVLYCYVQLQQRQLQLQFQHEQQLEYERQLLEQRQQSSSPLSLTFAVIGSVWRRFKR